MNVHETAKQLAKAVLAEEPHAVHFLLDLLTEHREELDAPTPRFCKDCKHHHRVWNMTYMNQCHHPTLTQPLINYATGNSVDQRILCEDKNADGMCKLFTAKRKKRVKKENKNE